MGAIIDSNEELKKHSVSDDHFRNIDITSKLWHDINMMQDKKRSGLRSFKRKTVMSIAVSCIFLASFTAYAATGHIQIFNSKGKVVVKTVDPSTTTLPAKLSNSLEEYRQRVLTVLKPGELAAYYIKDDYINKLNGYDTANPIKFGYLPIEYRSYEAFLTEQVRTSAPLLKKPGYLPKGISFSYGQVFPLGPQRYEREKYDKLEKNLMVKANSSKNEEKLFIEKLDWSKANNTFLYLANGKNSGAVIIQAGYALRLSLTQTPNASSEKIQLKHMEAIYINNKTGGDEIAWYDSKQSIAYSIWVNEEDLLSKKELQKMAESMITD
ncbi:hypothetical protein SAMN05661091_2572 [Paenibacillus uliginis N3/975]|uniref:DUF4367 domain-containing protein n=1 Tax=Paenibacillus uliginis N3/975 TaxID=1313296 RepID=A0A1X7HCZ5_9BACL|nr:hypothetical protein [Paenibacillus uliginis]SMF84261.1 hypothetical protein SAMN05661091_2572 [Paenibacillus uliginis N3/975]